MQPSFSKKLWTFAFGLSAALLLAASMMWGQAHAAGMPAETAAQATTVAQQEAKSSASAPEKAQEKTKEEGEKKD
jgi:hypothetical protein